MGEMTAKPVRIVELLEDHLGKLLGDIIYIFKIDHRYMVHRREKLIASFKMKPLPGQCGVCMLYNLEVKDSVKKLGIGTLLLDKALNIAKEQEYTSVMVTVLKTDDVMIKMLTKQEFELLYQFRNYRTKNAVLVMQKQIREVR